jgi:hypothetical protein
MAPPRAADAGSCRKQRIELTRPGEQTLGQLEAHFDICADRLLTQLPEAELIEVTAAREHITAIVLADMQSMKRQGTGHPTRAPIDPSLHRTDVLNSQDNR